MPQDADGLRQFAKRCDAEVKRKRADQRAIHERLGARMQSEVRSQIRGKLNDAHGHISGVQARVVGSGGGYAAVRPSGTDSGPDSLNAITNYLENGHAIRRPSGRNPRYWPRIKMLYVSGRGFYNAARPSLPHMLQSEVDKWGREVAGRLEGR
nr:hypothetical protein [uncultured Agathobaculum sp.]